MRGGALKLPFWVGVPMAAALVAATLLLRFQLYSGDDPLLIFFIMPIILSAYFGGMIAGLAGTFLTFAASDYFLLPPLYSLTIEKPGDHLQWTALLVIGVILTLLIEALHRSGRRRERGRQMLAVTLGGIDDAVIVTDNRDRISFINLKAELTTGWARADALGRRLAAVFRIVSEQTHQPMESPFEKVMRLGSAVELEDHTLLITKDGRKIPIDGSAAPIQLKDGTVHGVVMVLRDFTERKRALARAEYLASFPELSPGLVIEVNLVGEMTFCNPATTKTLRDLGMDEGDYTGLLPDDLEMILQNWDKEHESTLLREIKLKDRVFEETVHLVPQFTVARIYAYDITGRR